jgi:hypothetical protein
MIVNARMYSVSTEAGAVWRELLSAIIAQAGVPASVFDYPPPAPLEDLWTRSHRRSDSLSRGISRRASLLE